MPSYSHRVTFGNIKLHLQSASQSARLSRSSCKIRQSCKEYMILYRTQSSANRRPEVLIISGKSFMKIKNRIGPKTDPWGIPDKIGTGSEVWPSKTTCWLCPESQELTHLSVDPLIPWKSRFICNSLLCGTLSNALAKIHDDQICLLVPTIYRTIQGTDNIMHQLGFTRPQTSEPMLTVSK